MKKIITSLTIAACLIQTNLLAQEIHLDHLLKQSPFKNSQIGVIVEKIQPTRTVIYSYNADKLLTPASIMKAVVTAASLDYYGPSHSFKTEIFASRKPNWNGVINGNIYIKGWGDPSLTHEDIQSAAEALANQGIKMVQGNVIHDDTFFDRESPKPNLIKRFYTPPSALSVNRNTVSCIITDTHPRRLAPSVTTAYVKLNTSKVRVSTSKEIGYINARYQANGAGDTYTITGTATEGTVSKNMLTFLVSNPSLYAATLFKEALEREHISANKIIAGETPPKAISLYTIKGQPLTEILKVMNHDSDNMIAETLNKGMGAFFYSAPGTREKGAKHLKSFVTKNIWGCERWDIHDGSGLSPDNKVTVQGMNNVLKWTFGKPELRNAMIQSLPIQGVTDHYKDFKPNEKLVVYIKTGTLPQSGVNASTGYIHNLETGEWYVYTIIANLQSKYALQRGRLSSPILKAICEQLS